MASKILLLRFQIAMARKQRVAILYTVYDQQLVWFLVRLWLLWHICFEVNAQLDASIY